MAAENSALHHRNKVHFKIYSHRKQLLRIFHNIIVFTVFFLNKYSLVKHKRRNNILYYIIGVISIVISNHTLVNI